MSACPVVMLKVQKACMAALVNTIGKLIEKPMGDDRSGVQHQASRAARMQLLSTRDHSLLSIYVIWVPELAANTAEATACLHDGLQRTRAGGGLVFWGGGGGGQR